MNISFWDLEFSSGKCKYLFLQYQTYKFFFTNERYICVAGCRNVEHAEISRSLPTVYLIFMKVSKRTVELYQVNSTLLQPTYRFVFHDLFCFNSVNHFLVEFFIIFSSLSYRILKIISSTYYFGIILSFNVTCHITHEILIVHL